MEMHQIRYFLAVCDTRNFTRAAAACNVTQPALTRAIQKLEAEMGGLLLRRERGRTHLTELGQSHASSSRGDPAQHRKRRLDGEELPDLGGRSTPPRRDVHGGSAALRRPDEPVSSRASRRDSQPAGRRARSAAAKCWKRARLDLAVMAAPGGFAERFQVKPLYRERFVVAFPPGHRFERQKTVRTLDCGGESYLMRMNCEYGSYWDGFLDEHDGRAEGGLPQRARGLDPEHGHGRGRHLLPSGILACAAGPPHAPAGRARGPSRRRRSSPCPAGASRRPWRPSARP